MPTLKQVMTEDLVVLSGDLTILEAAEIMRDSKIEMMPVAGNKNELVGIITDRDIVIRGLAEGMDMDTRVCNVMSDDVFFAYEDDSLQTASEIMIKHNVRRLPVLTKENRLIGIVSLSNMGEVR
ncbi:MAG: CBS domain-containing protein [Candidatus Nitrotoga sp.]